ncbi:hypothetical protein Droror1_Dr00019907, partial [Drosera rotundifolia]
MLVLDRGMRTIKLLLMVVPFETQFLLIEVKEDGSHYTSGNLHAGEKQSALYAVFLPIIEGDFRVVLQGNSQDELEICEES